MGHVHLRTFHVHSYSTTASLPVQVGRLQAVQPSAQCWRAFVQHTSWIHPMCELVQGLHSMGRKLQHDHMHRPD